MHQHKTTPLTPGQERKRTCPKCGRPTFQTYKIYRKLFGGFLRYWECNRCENRSYFDS